MLGKAAGAPAGATARVLSNKSRSVDALEPYFARIEAHGLEQAKVNFDAQVDPGKLQLVTV